MLTHSRDQNRGFPVEGSKRGDQLFGAGDVEGSGGKQKVDLRIDIEVDLFHRLWSSCRS
jgi:hypothetical protein